MKLNFGLLFFLISTFVGLPVAYSEFQPFVFYEGSRMVEINLNSQAQQNLRLYAANNVGMVYPKEVRFYNDEFILKKSGIKKSYRLCDGEKLVHRWSTFFCSGAFVAPNKILTAAHCVENLSCKDFYLIREGTRSRLANRLPIENLFTCKEITKIKFRDLAVITTHQEYDGPITPVTTEFKAQAPEKIFMLGHPLGMPLHKSEGVIFKQSSPGTCYADITSFEGNSGSAVYSQRTGQMIGVFVEGEKDFLFDRKSRCYRFKQCPIGRCSGEKVLTVNSSEWIN